MAWLGVWTMDICSPNLVNFGLLFRAAKIFHSGFLAHFLSDGDEIR